MFPSFRPSLYERGKPSILFPSIGPTRTHFPQCVAARFPRSIVLRQWRLCARPGVPLYHTSLVSVNILLTDLRKLIDLTTPQDLLGNNGSVNWWAASKGTQKRNRQDNRFSTTIRRSAGAQSGDNPNRKRLRGCDIFFINTVCDKSCFVADLFFN